MFRLLWRYKVKPASPAGVPIISNGYSAIPPGLRPAPSYRPPRIILFEDHLRQRFVKAFPDAVEAQRYGAKGPSPASVFVARQLQMMSEGMSEENAFQKLSAEIVERRAAEKDERVRRARDIGALPPLFLETRGLKNKVSRTELRRRLRQAALAVDQTKTQLTAANPETNLPSE